MDNNSLLSKPWQKFLAKFDEINSVPIAKWKEYHLLSYFCQRYQNHFRHSYALSYRGAPSKCAEIQLIKKMIAMFNNTNMKFLKAYIDWIFEKKIIPSNLKIRTIGFLTTPGLGNEFLFFHSKKERIEKSTQLPSEYKQIAESLDVTAATYGDLAFIKMAIDQSEDNSRANYRLFYNNILALGFEPSILASLV